MTLEEAKACSWQMVLHENGGPAGTYVTVMVQRGTNIVMEKRQRCLFPWKFGKPKYEFVAPLGRKWRKTYEEAFTDFINQPAERREGVRV